jgi:glycosyltransferase involved in cell wall biosynthesis
MALGTPVISTSKGIEGLDLQAGCHAMVADAADGFASGVLAVLNRPDEACRMADAARALVRHRYDWTASGEALECALERARDRFNRARRDRT